MLIEEDVKAGGGEINPDVLEAGFEDAVLIEEEEVFAVGDGAEEEADEIDIAFQANDEGYW